MRSAGSPAYGYEINFGVGHPRSTVEVFRGIADACNSEFYGQVRYSANSPISHEAQALIETLTFAHSAIIATRRDPEAHGRYYGRRYRKSDLI